MCDNSLAYDKRGKPREVTFLCVTGKVQFLRVNSGHGQLDFKRCDAQAGICNIAGKESGAAKSRRL